MAETVRHRILLIEPSAIVARGIREILSRYPEFEVIDTLPDLGHCTERLTLLSPDAVLVDPCLFDYQKRTSDRENEILVAVARGMTNKEIADRYNISIHTVISHRKNIARKTGIKSVSGLTVYALLNNMIDQGDVE